MRPTHAAIDYIPTTTARPITPRALSIVPSIERAPAPATETAVWEAPVADARTAPPTTSALLGQQRAPEVSAELERAMIAIITAPLQIGESHATGATRREHELGTLFMQLAAIEALQVSRRLEIDGAADPLAIAFRRLTVERRQRLHAALANRRRMLAGLRR